MFDPSAVEIQTDRLLLRRFGHADLDAFVAYRSDGSVARFQSWGPSYSKADAAGCAPISFKSWLKTLSVADGPSARNWVDAGS